MTGDPESREGPSPTMGTSQRGAMEKIAESQVKEGKIGSEHLNGLAPGMNSMMLNGT